MSRSRGFFAGHSKSSALVVALVIHAVFLGVALSVVAVKVIVKDDASFEARQVKRPSMKLRKLQVPVERKKQQAPKLRKTLVSRPKAPTVDIKLPEIVGVKGGLGSGAGGGLGSLGFGFDMDLFGAGRGTGNEFIGTFYDLKQTSEGEPTHISNDDFMNAIRNFTLSGFDERKLAKYFKAPKLKYTTAFMLPPMSADAAPKAFDVAEQVKPKQWICFYKGQIAAPEAGRYRFWGLGDDILTVRVDNQLVLDACWVEHIKKLSKWTSDDPDNRKFSSDTSFPGYKYDKDYIRKNSRLVIGDWFTLRKGQRVDMQVLIGEFPGGSFSARLLIEQGGRKYEMVESDAGTRPVLPVFKTTGINEKLVEQMNINPGIATTEGPVFGVLINGNEN